MLRRYRTNRRNTIHWPTCAALAVHQDRHSIATPRCVVLRLNLCVSAVQLAETVDLDSVPYCTLCLMDLTEELRHGRTPSRALVRRTVDWVWMESGKAVRAAVVRARMQEVPFAEEALREIDARGWRSGFAEAIVLRLARELAEEFGPY